MGNRAAVATQAGTVQYDYDNANRLTSVGGVPYSWDDNGNLTSDGVNTYTYDAANRLTAVSGGAVTASYTYNGLGQRVSQVANGTANALTLDITGELSQVLADASNRYLYGNERLGQESGSGMTYFQGDALGSVRQLVNGAGEVTGYQAYDPFGQLQSAFAAGGSPYGYAGEWQDASGLVNLRARGYAPALGRFLTRDPFPGFTNLPVTLHPYLYAANNPILYTDPSGKMITPLIGAGLKGLVSGGIELATQLNQTRGIDFLRSLQCLNWGQIGIAAGAGAIASLAGGANYDPWITAGEFFTGMVYEFALNMPWATSPSRDVLTVNNSDSTARLVGRVAGDVLAMAAGGVYTVGGTEVALAGVASCGTGVLCPIGVGATVAGGVVAAVGVTTAYNGASNIGQNVAKIAGKGQDSAPKGLFEQNNIRTTDHFNHRLAEWGISEQEAYKIYQNGDKYTDTQGGFIIYDSKKGLAIRVDNQDKGAMTIFEQKQKPRGWTHGWFNPEMDGY